MKQQILEMLNSIPEKEQNDLLLDIRNTIKQDRLTKAMQLEREASRIKDTLNTI